MDVVSRLSQDIRSESQFGTSRDGQIRYLGDVGGILGGNLLETSRVPTFVNSEHVKDIGRVNSS